MLLRSLGRPRASSKAHTFDLLLVLVRVRVLKWSELIVEAQRHVDQVGDIIAFIASLCFIARLSPPSTSSIPLHCIILIVILDLNSIKVRSAWALRKTVGLSWKGSTSKCSLHHKVVVLGYPQALPIGMRNRSRLKLDWFIQQCSKL